jgi:hypothetical protein
MEIVISTGNSVGQLIDEVYLSMKRRVDGGYLLTGSFGKNSTLFQKIEDVMSATKTLSNSCTKLTMVFHDYPLFCLFR